MLAGMGNARPGSGKTSSRKSGRLSPASRATAALSDRGATPVEFGWRYHLILNDLIGIGRPQAGSDHQWIVNVALRSVVAGDPRIVGPISRSGMPAIMKAGRRQEDKWPLMQ